MTIEGSRENLTIPGEVLKELAVEASDKGFDVHIDARGEDAVAAAFEALAAARSAGYKKNALILVHSPVTDADELSDNCYHLGVTEITRQPVQ
jgi:predicted amidohydrolase YtcJ